MLGNAVDYLRDFGYCNPEYYNNGLGNYLFCSKYNPLGHQTFKIDENIEIKVLQFGYLQDFDPLRDENKTFFHNVLKIAITINNINVIEFELKEKQPARWGLDKINKKFKMPHDIDRVINTWCYKQLKQKETEENRIKEKQEYEQKQKELEYQQVQEKLNEIYKQYRKRG